jgi:PAS domain S-box-containing protein
VDEPECTLNEAWLRAVWSAATDAIALSDADGRVLAANPAYYGLYGYTPAEVLGQSFAVIFPASERRSAEARYAQVFADPDRQPPFQSVVCRRDGTQRIVESRISFLEEDGHRVAMLSVVRDVTEEVTARRESAHAEEARQEFVASLTHDITSPLAVIKGHAQVLRRQMNQRGSAPPLERLMAAVSQIEASAQQLAGLVDELTEMAGLAGDGTPALRVTEADGVALARDAIARHQRLAAEHQLILNASISAARGKWDVTRVQRVLDNLISNAVKYSPGGGTVTIGVALAPRPLKSGGSLGAVAPEAADNVVEMGAAEAGSGVLLTVRDSGIGIRAADLPHVFERLHRGRNVPSTAGGSGIGLSNVQQIVQQHGGTVAIASREGEGTTVTVWLPLEPAGPGDAGSQ